MTHLNIGFYADGLKKNSRVVLALPTASPARAVLWLLHPPGGSCFDWERNTGAERYAQRAGVILVMPSSDRCDFQDPSDPMFPYLGEALPEFLAKLVLPLAESVPVLVAGPGAEELRRAYPRRFARTLPLETAGDWAGLDDSLRRALEALF